MKITILAEDNREIASIFDGPSMYEVGHEGVTKIVPYEENGDMAPIPWFAIFKGDFLWQRVRAVGVRYAQEAIKGRFSG